MQSSVGYGLIGCWSKKIVEGLIERLGKNQEFD